VFNATFNNISVISWRSFLLVKETVVSGKTTDLSQVTDTFYHVSTVPIYSIKKYTSPLHKF
jgi:hypothetical protein